MTHKKPLFALVGVALLIGLFFFFKSSKQQNSIPTPTSKDGAQETSNSAAPSNAKVFELIVKNRKLVSGSETLLVKQGDMVTIKITVDEDEELHLHGYDKSVDITKDQPTQLNFKANLTGHFPYELERSKTEIGALEVMP